MTPPVFVASSADLRAAVVGGAVRLDGPEGRHAAAVRRIAVGETLHLVDGEGGRVIGMVASVVDRQSIEVTVTDVAAEPAPQPRVVVVQALPKGDRGELAVELLTEIGVDVIVPWAATNCVTQWKGERRERGQRRWADAANAAAKQARRAWFPVVTDLASTVDVVSRLRDASAALVLHESALDGIAGARVPDEGDLVIVVGPEGGLTADELGAFTAAGAQTMRLGPSVLRTSSAGMAAVAAVLGPTSRWAVRSPRGMEG